MEKKTKVIRFGKYSLIASLATGGMAEILLARQKGIGGFEKLLVIKRILPHLAIEDMFVKMFLDEARLAARLNHQNIVQIYDVGCEDGRYFIAMEYLEGECLAAVLKRARKAGRAPSPALAAGIALQICEGLEYAHDISGRDGKPLNVVHRDVNPQNIFVLYSGGAKLVDFGIAKATERIAKTQAGTLKGKYSYMSPEQIYDQHLDKRADVYSLGVVLWELLAGRKLFGQANNIEILRAITDQDAPPPSSVVPSVPKILDEITLRALSRSRELRFQSAGEMRMELSTFLKSEKEPSDTVAIREYMQLIFSDRIVEKHRLVKSATTGKTNMEKLLFGDLSLEKSDSGSSISLSTPSHGLSVPPPVEAPTSPMVQPFQPASKVKNRSFGRIIIYFLGIATLGALVFLAAFCYSMLQAEILAGNLSTSVSADLKDEINKDERKQPEIMTKPEKKKKPRNKPRKKPRKKKIIEEEFEEVEDVEDVEDAEDVEDVKNVEG